MHRVARVGFIVNDLRRSRTGHLAAWVAARLTTRNRLTRNDAPLSVLRAYTPDELAGLACEEEVESRLVIGNVANNHARDDGDIGRRNTVRKMEGQVCYCDHCQKMFQP